ncbi:ABC transporter ATP-binding protein [Desulfomonile tiedjei]|uniref:ABC-type nitrate/sulfonate/bicarbonate transport system, ATPase component n=1 Tax=Desulfomonile tiedjei (strain ATCC 49306 / DSM 6799 / DCB-1) TaxID=706587 RepID=I4C2Q6_DESTA|nr:ATP-binding cassette domain-containing protein [Desulfomonile tiedjei]AFM23847.1 ABC-type nitrate/sulfonate/bicarbonate transport system, ATPase component [Desulfomonile tiedjei DSM 6799]
MLHTSHELMGCIAAAKMYLTDNGPIPALSATDFALCPGETAAIVGPSGCGKSTLLLLMAGLEQPTSGHLLFKGEPLRRPHREIALVLQDYGLFPWKSVRDNVELGLKIRNEPIEEDRTNELLTELDIGEKGSVYPQQLSGGQKQRVALARALILKPSLLLLDEPFAALDTLTRERLQDLVADLWGKLGFGMVVVTHNIQEAVRLGRRILVMGGTPGKVLETVENPLGCTENYRGTDIFYEMYKQVRGLLEQNG